MELLAGGLLIALPEVVDSVGVEGKPSWKSDSHVDRPLNLVFNERNMGECPTLRAMRLALDGRHAWGEAIGVRVASSAWGCVGASDMSPSSIVDVADGLLVGCLIAYG